MILKNQRLCTLRRISCEKQIKWLKIAYLAGIKTDALALIIMPYPPIADLMWGFDNFNGEYLFEIGFQSSLMLCWALLSI